MNTSKPRKIAGFVIHLLIGGLMIFAASTKLLGTIPPDKMPKGGIGEQLTLIGIGELTTAILLLVPRTSSLGVLLASGFWGGAICLHMSLGDSYVFQSGLLAFTWLGAWLRNPATFSSFAGCCGVASSQ